MTVEAADLIAILSRCKSTLLKVTMRLIYVLDPDNDSVWRKVFGMLASMPRLSKIRLQWL